MSHILYLSTATIYIASVCFAPFHHICFYWCHPCSNAIKRFPSIKIKEVATRADLGEGEVFGWFNLHCSEEAIPLPVVIEYMGTMWLLLGIECVGTMWLPLGIECMSTIWFLLGIECVGTMWLPLGI
jgi:hypothetical protein